MQKLSICIGFIAFVNLSAFFLSPLHARELTVNNELFVEIEELIIPIVQRRDVAGFFSVTLAIDCKTLKSSERVTKYLPIIRDRFFWDLYVLLGVIWEPGFRVNLPDLKKRLLLRLQNLIGEEHVNSVLVISFQQHKRRSTSL